MQKFSSLTPCLRQPFQQAQNSSHKTILPTNFHPKCFFALKESDVKDHGITVGLIKNARALKEPHIRA